MRRQLTIVVSCCLALWLFNDDRVRGNNEGGQPKVIIVDRDCKDGLRLVVEGKRIALSSLLGAFANEPPVPGQPPQLVVLGKDGATIGDLKNVRAIVDKAGFKDIRLYSYDPQRQLMSEMSIAYLGVPVSVSVPAEISR